MPTMPTAAGMGAFPERCELHLRVVASAVCGLPLHTLVGTSQPPRWSASSATLVRKLRQRTRPDYRYRAAELAPGYKGTAQAELALGDARCREELAVECDHRIHLRDHLRDRTPSCYVGTLWGTRLHGMDRIDRTTGGAVGREEGSVRGPPSRVRCGRARRAG